MGWYVDITDVPAEKLEFLGYFPIAQDDEFLLYANKSEAHVVQKHGPRRWLYVEDLNDAHILGFKAKVPAPPDGKG